MNGVSAPNTAGVLVAADAIDLLVDALRLSEIRRQMIVTSLGLIAARDREIRALRRQVVYLRDEIRKAS